MENGNDAICAENDAIRAENDAIQGENRAIHEETAYQTLLERSKLALTTTPVFHRRVPQPAFPSYSPETPFGPLKIYS